MKCEFCGANIGLEDLVCPHCGRENTVARKHAVQMIHYKNDYQETKEEVLQKARRFSGNSVRITLIAVLILLIVISFIVAAKSYSTVRVYREKQTEKNAEAVIAKIRMLVDEERYVELGSMADNEYIDVYDGPFESYGRILRASQSFRNVYEDVLRCAYPAEYARTEREISYLSDALGYFYDSMDPERYYGDAPVEPLTEKTFSGLKKACESLLVTYIGISPGEASEFPEYTPATRSYKLEQALSAGKEAGNE